MLEAASFEAWLFNSAKFRPCVDQVILLASPRWITHWPRRACIRYRDRKATERVKPVTLAIDQRTVLWTCGYWPVSFRPAPTLHIRACSRNEWLDWLLSRSAAG